tara:strand:- start:322 stop:525 length:204 start_codon:yes stop_codon:yes gene_type:complete
MIGTVCAFCTHSDYNQKTGDHDGVVREFCGMIIGGDTTTKKLSKCWLKMTKYEKTKFKKDTVVVTWK